MEHLDESFGIQQVVEVGNNKAFCVAKNCGLRYPEVALFRFPKDEETCTRWIENIGITNLIGKEASICYNS